MEKWLQSKGNPYSNPTRSPFAKPTNPYGKPKRVSSPPHHRAFKHTKLHRAHYGKPIQLFKDSDKDGVANVFDCKPFNKKKQDVISPMSGGSPFMDMYNRQEWARRQAQQQKAYEKQMEEARILEEQRIAELQRISTPGAVNYYSTSNYYTPTVYDPKTNTWYSVESAKGKEVAKQTTKDIEIIDKYASGQISDGAGGSYNPLSPTIQQQRTATGKAMNELLAKQKAMNELLAKQKAPSAQVTNVKPSATMTIVKAVVTPKPSPITLAVKSIITKMKGGK